MNIYLGFLIIFVIGFLYKINILKLVSTENFRNVNETLSKALFKIKADNGLKNIGEVKEKTIFRPGSMTVQLKKNISCLLHPLIIKLNNLVKSHHIIHEFDIIILETDINGNKKFLIDFFILNTHTSVKKRLITEIILEKKTKKPTVNYIRLSNAKYLDEPNQIIGKDIHNIGTNYVIKPENTNDLNLQQLKKDFIGENRTELESSTIDYQMHNNGYQKPSEIRNDWIQPIEANNLEYDKSPVFPHRKIYNRWNKKGIQSTDNIGDKKTGLNSGNYNRRVVAQYNPTIHTLPRDNLGLAGYFDLATGIPSFPTSTCKPSTKSN